MLLGRLTRFQVVSNHRLVLEADDAPERARTLKLNDVLGGPGAPLKRLKIVPAKKVHPGAALVATQAIRQCDLSHQQFGVEVVARAEHVNFVTNAKAVCYPRPEIGVETVIELLRVSLD